MNKDSRINRRLSDSQFGVILILPALAVFLSVILYPFLKSITLSFTNLSLLSPKTSYVGFANFMELFHNPYLYEYIKNTIVFVAGTTLIPFVLGFIWAIVLNHGFKGSEFLKGITLVNWIIPSTAIGFLWIWIFQGNYGFVNYILKMLGVIKNDISWLGRVDTAMIAVIIAKSWQTLPWFMAYLIGGLNMVPKEQIEAARIDGANNLMVFRHVIWSNMRMIISFLLILGAIGNLQHFDILWVMTQGGPIRSTTTLSVAVYRTAFQEWNIGMAATIGVIWVVMISLFAVFYLRHILREDLK
ncbi:MAG TPA: sugar ABC transporter permease [Bacilli bacterium]